MVTNVIFTLKFRYSEKALEIWPIFHFLFVCNYLVVASNYKWKMGQILWHSQNIWTLITQCITFCFFIWRILLRNIASLLGFSTYFSKQWYFVTKIVLTYCEKLKFEAEGREFAKILRSLEQFIQTVKGQNNFFNLFLEVSQI